MPTIDPDHTAASPPQAPVSHHRGKMIAVTGAVALVLGVPVATTAAARQSSAADTPAVATRGPAPRTLTGKGHHDRGPRPTVYNIDRITGQNAYYRDTFWTGQYLQLTVMSIKRHDDIGLEMHPALDQFIRVESGVGLAKMGPSQKRLTYVRRVDKHSAILIPAGTWHDVVNTGRVPLKVYSIYAPPNHPRATLHKTKKDAQNDPLEKIKYPQDFEAK